MALAFLQKRKVKEAPAVWTADSAFSRYSVTDAASRMMKSIKSEKELREGAVTEEFLENPNEESFAALFKIFSPQLVSFFRALSREIGLAEDLAQDVMFTVYRKAGQIRDRTLFRAWLFKIAHNTLSGHYLRMRSQVETVNLADVDHRLATAAHKAGGNLAFEFRDWMGFLDERERDVMTLRFVEEWEYHEIAAAQGTPVGTIQWRIFNSKKKLAKHLSPGHATRTQPGHELHKNVRFR
jgi:RNA polymerase sigma-70 factor (ECF subfamily)